MATGFNFCSSQRKISKETFIWTIHDFSELDQKAGEFVESAILTSTSSKGNPLKWQIQIYPNGDSADANGHVSIYIRLVELPEAEPEVTAKIIFTIKDTSHALALTNQKFNSNFPSWGFRKFVQRNTLFDEQNGFLPDDRLNIACRVIVRGETMELECGKIVDIEVPECRMTVDMGYLFEKNLFTDCRIVAEDGREFKVHKCILACRSEVFEKMFGHEMSETHQGIVKIDDIKSNVIEQMLRFIYSGAAPKLAEMAEEMLAAADKYVLDRLKIICERELANSLGNENVCELFVLANRHSATHLEAEAIKYIQKHAKEVMDSDGWKMLVKGNYGELMDKIVKAFVATPK